MQTRATSEHRLLQQELSRLQAINVQLRPNTCMKQISSLKLTDERLPLTFQVTCEDQIMFLVEPDKLHSKDISHKSAMRQPHAPDRPRRQS